MVTNERRGAADAIVRPPSKNTAVEGDDLT
jgi:hypothetical protein